MSRRIVSPPFDIVVGDRDTGRSRFRMQYAIGADSRVINGAMTGDIGSTTGSVDVTSASFGLSSVAASGHFSVVSQVTTPASLGVGSGTLTGVEGARTPGNDDFSVDGAPDDVAADIAAAINDAGNSFAAEVSAVAVGSAVVVTYVVAGFAGNTYPLTSSSSAIQSSSLSGGYQPGAEDRYLSVGGHKIVPGVNWEVVSGDPTATAANLAASISRLPGFSAQADGGTVSITGPTSGDLSFSTNCRGVVLDPENGELSSSQKLGPPVIL